MAHERKDKNGATQDPKRHLQRLRSEPSHERDDLGGAQRGFETRERTALVFFIAQGGGRMEDGLAVAATRTIREIYSTCFCPSKSCGIRFKIG